MSVQFHAMQGGRSMCKTTVRPQEEDREDRNARPMATPVNLNQGKFPDMVGEGEETTANASRSRLDCHTIFTEQLETATRREKN